jgi:beta-aspartyl-dipeptidase (metallo-type)
MNPEEAVARARAAGIPLERITLSSDANVSMPTRDAQGRQVGLHNAPPSILHEAFVQTQRRNDLPLPEALPLVTTNVARVLGLGARKGRIAPGLDADLLALDRDLAVRTVLCRGRVMLRDGRPIVKGPYEA